MASGRYIGIVGDGGTDRDILACIVHCAFGAGPAAAVSPKVVHLKRQGMRDSLDKYWHLVGKGRGVRIADEPARTLQKGVVATLYGAWDELRSHANRELTRRDMVLVSSDAERYLSNADAYFQEWAWMVGMAVLGGVEKFHHALSSRGYTLDFIPVVVPVIPFPSTDLLIAVARNRQGGGLPERGADPRRLKLALYGTEHLMSLRPEDLHERALKHISADAILAMYSAVPEVRPLLHWLCWASDGA